MSRPRNIVRIDIDNSNTHGWQVRITRHRKRHTKFFSDQRYGSAEAALVAAEAYRDEMLPQFPDPLPANELSLLARSPSGVPGVRLAFDSGIPRIEANMVTVSGERKVRSFSVRKWGLRKALWKACAWKAAGRSALAQTPDVQKMYEKAYPTIKRQLERHLRERKEELVEMD